ncbi:hypothetical protein MCAMS1_00639 [biofilm metagenome]
MAIGIRGCHDSQENDMDYLGLSCPITSNKGVAGQAKHK